jgi:hypothetical protein
MASCCNCINYSVMRRRGWVWLAWGAFLFHGGLAVAQNSLQTLEQELKEATQQHQEITSATLTNFFSQVDAAMASPDAAISLYAQVRSTQPDSTPPGTGQDNEASLLALLRACDIPPTPVVTEHTEETETEKAARLAVDQANLARLGAVLQLHCGLLHYGALFVVKPDQKGLQNDWVEWLKSAAQIYLQTSVPAGSGEQNPVHHNKRKRNNGDDDGPAAGGPSPFNPSDMKGKALRDSPISKFLGFNTWDAKASNAGDASGSSSDSQQPGKWSVQDLPELFRANVLAPLRVSPTAATLAAWDAYIALANADEPDADRWNEVVYPPLQFDRACDDYAIAPDTEKLEGLVDLIKANPTNPHTDDWIARVHQLLLDYSARHGGAVPVAQNSATAPAPSTTDPNVTVTTVQQGDMTIITTHTNAALANPPPAH